MAQKKCSLTTRLQMCHTKLSFARMRLAIFFIKFNFYKIKFLLNVYE